MSNLEIVLTFITTGFSVFLTIYIVQRSYNKAVTAMTAFAD